MKDELGLDDKDRQILDLNERVEELEAALIILDSVPCHWNLHVSQDDEFLVDRVLSEIKSK
jgi:hypothetical protein